MRSLCPKAALGTITTDPSNPPVAPPRACGFLGCQTIIPAPDFPWSMCDPCYGHWSDVDDSEMED